jgi:hypothetical protein
MLVTALAVTMSAGVLTAAQAGAAGPNGKTVCSTVSGTVTGTITVSGCVDANTASTGGSSNPVGTTSLATGGTLTWINGKTITFTAATVTPTNPKKCPGYVKGAATNPTADKFTGGVTASTSGMKIPGKIKGAVCISHAGAITALKPLKVN